MNTILTTEIKNNSARLFFANLIDSASAGNLYFDGQNEQLLNMVESEGGWIVHKKQYHILVILHIC